MFAALLQYRVAVRLKSLTPRNMHSMALLLRWRNGEQAFFHLRLAKDAMLAQAPQSWNSPRTASES